MSLRYDNDQWDEAKEGNANEGINADTIILKMHENNILLKACFS